MRLVGLTGGIGSGKSTVATRLADLGCEVIDADRIARDIVQPGSPVLQELAQRFGGDVLARDGSLDRAALASLAFADDVSRGDLDRIMHPRIAARIAARVAEVAGDEDRGAPSIVVVDHPLLVETRQAARFDDVVVVMAPREARLRRLVDRGMDEADALRRMAAQADDSQRRAVATHVIENGGSLERLFDEVDRLHGELREAARAEPQGPR